MRRRRRTEPNFAAIDDAEDEFQDSAPRWRRIDAFVVLGVVLVAGAIVTNALFLQKGPHPSPIFANKQTPPAANDTVGTIILPRPRPMEPEPAKADAPAARSRADIVSDIQKELARRGFYDGVADGVYGAKTDVAIRDFERAGGLKPGSEPGEPLLQAIIRSSAKAAPVPPASVPRSSDPIAELIGPSKKVTMVQQALSDYGYGQIKPTGILDTATQQAIEQFERSRKLPVTGQVSPRLIRELAALTGRPLE